MRAAAPFPPVDVVTPSCSVVDGRWCCNGPDGRLWLDRMGSGRDMRRCVVWVALERFPSIESPGATSAGVFTLGCMRCQATPVQRARRSRSICLAGWSGGGTPRQDAQGAPRSPVEPGQGVRRGRCPLHPRVGAKRRPQCRPRSQHEREGPWRTLPGRRRAVSAARPGAAHTGGTCARWRDRDCSRGA